MAKLFFPRARFLLKFYTPGFFAIRFVLKKVKVAANWLFGLLLTLSFTFIKMTMVGNVNLVSYGNFNFPCMHKLRPLDVNCPKNVGF